MIALLLGTALALAALAYVLAPLFLDTPDRESPVLIPSGVAAEMSRSCVVCGPRPESDATYCSTCGRFLGGPCVQCGATLDQPGARYCAACGHAVGV